MTGEGFGISPVSAVLPAAVANGVKRHPFKVKLGRGLINGQPNVGVDAPPNVRFRAHKRHQAQAKLSAMHVLTLSISSLFNMESDDGERYCDCLLYTSPSPRDGLLSRMPS